MVSNQKKITLKNKTKLFRWKQNFYKFRHDQQLTSLESLRQAVLKGIKATPDITFRRSTLPSHFFYCHHHPVGPATPKEQTT